MLYFIPHVKSFSHALEKHPWLRDVIPLAQARETMRGPGDVAGLIAADRLLPTEFMTYAPDLQRWNVRYGSDVMIGLRPDWTPTPQFFARPNLMEGQSLELLDGQTWVIPQLLSYDADQLDGPLSYRNLCDRVLEQSNKTGRFVAGAVTPPYRELWQMGIAIGDHLLKQITAGAATADLSDDALESFTAALLGHNYRLGKPEISALGLLSNSLARQIVRIGVDWATLETNLKNRLSRPASDGTNTESGSTPPTEASDIITDPPSPS